MSFIKDNWLLLLILALIAYFAYKYYKRVKLEKLNVANLTNASQLNGLVKSSGGVTVAPVVNTTPVINTNNSTWKIGDKIYAGVTGVNAYSSPSSGVNSLVKFYSKDNYIGTFLSIENGYAKVIIQESTNSLLQAFGYEDNAVRFLLISQIYSK